MYVEWVPDSFIPGSLKHVAYGSGPVIWGWGTFFKF